MNHVHLFRHGQTDWNRLGRFQGHTDVALNETGRAQARELIPYFREHPVQTFLSSDLSRAHETASILAESLGLEVHQSEALREFNFGEGEGLSTEEIERRWGPDVLQRFYSVEPECDDCHFPGGESKRYAIERVLAGMDAFLDRTGFESIGVACHGGIIRRLLRELAPDRAGPGRVRNGDVFELQRRSGEWRWHTS
jgi:broad specificity phosphatase PhoE